MPEHLGTKKREHGTRLRSGPASKSPKSKSRGRSKKAGVIVEQRIVRARIGSCVIT